MPDEYWTSVARAAEEKVRLEALKKARGLEQRLRETAARGRALARKYDAAGRLHCAHCRRWIPQGKYWKDKAAKTRKMSWCKKCLADRTPKKR